MTLPDHTIVRLAKKRKKMRVLNCNAKPTLPLKQVRGSFPYSLTIGFEAEFFLRQKTREMLLKNNNGNLDIFQEVLYIPLSLIGDSACEQYYFKRDSSCEMEMNSFPFNYNWLLANEQFLEKHMDNMKKHAFVNRDCGFHVHVAKKYFSRNHAMRFQNFFYDYKNFFKKMSLRQRAFSEGSHADCYASFDRKKQGRYVAVNITNKNTIEIRIFQGTLKWKIVRAYIEMVMGVAIYTKDEHNPTIYGYKNFLRSNKETYKNALTLISNKKSNIWK